MTDSVHQETGKIIEVCVGQHCWHGEMCCNCDLSRSEIIEAARGLEGAEEVLLPDMAMYADDNIVVEAGRYLLIPVADARRTEEEGT